MHKHMKDRKINKAREQTSERPDMNFNGYLFMQAMFIVVCYGECVYWTCTKFSGNIWQLFSISAVYCM